MSVAPGRTGPVAPDHTECLPERGDLTIEVHALRFELRERLPYGPIDEDCQADHPFRLDYSLGDS